MRLDGQPVAQATLGPCCRGKLVGCEVTIHANRLVAASHLANGYLHSFNKCLPLQGQLGLINLGCGHIIWMDITGSQA